MACGHYYYGDATTVEPRFAGRSGQRANWVVHAMAGIPFAANKHQKIRCANAFTGVVTGFASRPGYVVLRVNKSRRVKLQAALKGILETGELTSTDAASIGGSCISRR